MRPVNGEQQRSVVTIQTRVKFLKQISVVTVRFELLLDKGGNGKVDVMFIGAVWTDRT